ncbi:hypothetical protein AQJ84_29135 [Streptomyces resistomycificus]|uniref:Uncharacterized protein n=1 Tax=Streptomyces resistomycificus TaxID=67356 RepID=A0A0L8L128_9ACTN|nr:hypothetical protein ADK37_29190 [Streptomyces resistomycificus]KUN93427.1 hypothetical protein AQJ84_29135 [Streptomyces resistomycificus]
MIASWRSFSTLTAAVYSSLPSTCLGVGMSSTVLRTARVSRGGMALRTDARPVAAAVIWVPAVSAKVASSRACLTRFSPHVWKAVADSPSHSTLPMWLFSSLAAFSMASLASHRALPAVSRSSGFADSTRSIMAFRSWLSKSVLPKTRGTPPPKGKALLTNAVP